jgi:hypothetical protein
MAGHSLRTLGVLLLLLTMCPVISLVFSAAGPAEAVLVALIVLIYGVPAVLCIVAAIFLFRYQFWPVVLGLVMTGLMIFGTLAVVVGAVINLVGGVNPDANVVFWVIIGIGVLLLLAFGQLAYQLAQSFRAVHEGPQHLHREEGRGFEVMPAEGPGSL